MADVLIVCVREDETLAKAFADMFERAGLHVGGAPGAPEDMRACGAALVVWSQASIRSRAFLDAAQRAVNAGKAVVACLIAPPPPASINHAPAFDLSHWTGDPDDPVLDPLFFSVDRMVAAARAAAGVPAPAAAGRAAEHPASYFNPAATAAPAPSAPPYARARTPAPPPPAVRPPPAPRNPSAYEAAPRMPAPTRRPPEPRRDPAPTARGHDPVADEAQNWAAIRHSRNPEDFLRHLADYGQEGAFAELAQMKLAELEAEARRRTKTPAAAARQDGMRSQSIRLDPTRPASPRPAARPEPRPEPRPEYRPEARRDPRYDAPARPEAPSRPPPAVFEPIRAERPAPPPRAPAPRPAARGRLEPQPAWRDEPPPGRDPYRPSRPPPRAGGGAVRLMVIIGILGAGALAAGLYAGDRLGGIGGLFASNTSPAGSDEAAWAGEESNAETQTAGQSSGFTQDDADFARANSTPAVDSQPQRQNARPAAPLERGGIEEPLPPRQTTTRQPPERGNNGNTVTTTQPSGQDQAVSTPASTPATSTGPTSGPLLPPENLQLPSAPPTDAEMRSAAVEPPQTAPQRPARAPQVVWASRPNAERINSFFPDRAMRQGRGGRVELECLLDAQGVPRCAVSSETPANMGFGPAAIRASTQFRAARTLDDGSPSAGAQVRIAIAFRPPAN